MSTYLVLINLRINVLGAAVFIYPIPAAEASESKRVTATSRFSVTRLCPLALVLVVAMSSKSQRSVLAAIARHSL